MPSRPDPSIGRPAPERPGAHAEPAGLDALLASYAVPAGHFDELREPGGAPRPHWRRFAAHAPSMSAESLAAQEAAAARQLHEDGVTYNVYADGDAPARPWALDVLPHLVPAAEWEPIARGVRQRARLLDAMAADLYGPQRLLADGAIPAALVHGHPGFLRPCHGVTPPGGVRLHQAAFDLLRDAGGRWWIAGTRTQAPSGSGYALENRLTVSRLHHEAFREMRVLRLAPFFLALQEALRDGAPCDAGEAPHVVLLTPGSYNETYFEHAYLARYLGFTLVEGGDLAVRDDRVYLKTLSGLERVHAILRRLDDDFCDPLELRPDSALGVPGLVQAWRAGQVLVANALGVGVLESAALPAFLPEVALRLLGEPLALPSVPTRWGGEAAGLDEAVRRWPDVVIKPALPDLRMDPVFASDLDAGAQARWLERLRGAPGRYALDDEMRLSHAPAARDGRIESRPLMLRVFAVADGRGDYRVMPGGLTRIAGDDRHVVSSQRGGSSKDTWILSDSPIEPLTLLPGRLRPDDIAISHRAVSSRAGENLFWLGRYSERSENCARLLRAVLTRLPDEGALGEPSPAVVRTCRRQGLLRAGEDVYAAAPHRLEPDLIAEMLDGKAGFSLAWNVGQTARVAAAARDRLSGDTARLIAGLCDALAAAPAATTTAAALPLIERAIVSLAAGSGIEMERMTRDHGWRFLSLGRYVERLLFVAATVGEVAAAGEDPWLLGWLLDLSDSAMTYRARYVRPPEWLAVADLLLCDRRNPRSAAFQLAKLATQVRQLPSAGLDDLVQEIAEAQLTCHIAEPASGGALLRPGALAAFLHRAEHLSLRLSDALALRYFSHVYEMAQPTAAL